MSGLQQKPLCIKKIVITGSTGTIGVSLVNLLTNKGIECILINVPSFVDESVYNNPGLITFIDGSIDDYLSLRDAENLPTDCDAFIHLAWAGSFGPKRDDTSLQLKNVQGTLDAIRLAKAMGCKAFVGAGSQAEYGKGVEETPHCIKPYSGYGMAKYAAGQFGKLLALQLGIRYNWIRIFSVYGPNLPSGSLTQYIVSSILNSTPPKLTPCEQLWDFLYTEDAAEAFFAVAINGVDGKIYELGSGESRTIRSFVEKIPFYLGASIQIEFGAIQYPENQIMRMCANVSELKSDTSWAPKHSFKEGILAIASSLGYIPGQE